MKKNRQEEVYEFLKQYTSSKGYPPSVREICKAVSLKSTSTVHGYLRKLEEKGLIKRDPAKPRALEITEFMNQKEIVEIPIVGKVTAGLPILATENIEDMFPMPIEYVRHTNELFILKITGDSMIEAGILDGDLAIIEQTKVAKNGDIVIALIENESTIKRFFKENDKIKLQPENENMEPIIVDNCTILGKLVSIYRQY